MQAISVLRDRMSANNASRGLQFARHGSISRAIPHAGSDDQTGMVPVSIFHPVSSGLPQG
jgi:hypothetical protein